MRLFKLLLCFVALTVASYAANDISISNETLVDAKYYIETDNIELYSKIADMKLVLNKMPPNMEFSANFLSENTINPRGEEFESPKYFNAVGLRYGFYGVKDWSLGIKGALNSDHFIERTINNFDFKSRTTSYVSQKKYSAKKNFPITWEDYYYFFSFKQDRDYTLSKTDAGIKLFAEGVYKPIPDFAIILWNDIVIDKIESNLSQLKNTDRTKMNASEKAEFDSLEYNDLLKLYKTNYFLTENNNFQPTLTVNPKILYEKQLVDGVKFLTEVYLEGKQPFAGRTISLGDDFVESMVKWTIKPHFNIDKEIFPNLRLIANNNITCEQIVYAKTAENKKTNGMQRTLELQNVQVIYRISPRLEYNTDWVKAGINGGEMRMEDEIGMNYDYYEMIAYKLVGRPMVHELKFGDAEKFESIALSTKMYGEYKIFDNVWIGYNFEYRYGEAAQNKVGVLLEVKKDSSGKVIYDKYAQPVYETKNIIQKDKTKIIQRVQNPYIKYVLKMSDGLMLQCEAGYKNTDYNYDSNSFEVYDSENITFKAKLNMNF